MAKRIDPYIIDRVKEAANIVRIVGEEVQLRRAGVNLTGLCPFHDDRHTGNFIVTPKGVGKHGNQYHCFVCGAHGNAVDFLMKHDNMKFDDAIRYIGRMESIEVDDVPVNFVPPPPKPLPPPPPPMVIPRAWVKGLNDKHHDCDFIRWLYTLPWTQEQRGRLRSVLWMYCVTGWKDGRVTFWYIDHEGVPRRAKFMRYHPQGHPKFGKRDHDEHPGWLHNQPGWRDEDGVYHPGPRDILKPDEHTKPMPLFGAHLLSRFPQAAVNVVESEKTAIVMQTYFGSPEKQLWLACGGLSYLQLEAMQPLIDQGRRVWLWPDADGREAWQQLCDKLGSDRVTVYDRFFETHYMPEEDGPKADVADIAIRIMAGGHRPQAAGSAHDGGEQGATDERHEAGCESGATPAPAYVSDGEPFLDPEELRDPRVREWRDIMRRAFPGKTRPTPPTSRIPGVRSVGEILQEHPIVRQLIERFELKEIS